MRLLNLRDKVVIYHAGCLDGMGAAATFQHWLLKRLEIQSGCDKTFVHHVTHAQLDERTAAHVIQYGVKHSERASLSQSQFTLDVAYVPAVYGKDYSDLNQMGANEIEDSLHVAYHEKDVYIVDFSLPIEQLVKIAAVANSVTVLDHHHTAFEMYKDWSPEEMPYNVNIELEYARSGATQTWWYLMGNEDYPMPIRHVEDRDLWKWQVDGTKEFTLAIYNGDDSFMKSVVGWQRLLSFQPATCEANYNALIDKGRIFKEYQDVSIKKHMKYVRFVKLAGGMYNVPVVNVTRDITSEILEQIIIEHKAPFAIAFIDGPDERWWSLRSKFLPDGNPDFPNAVDVSEIGKIMGGGGHQAASGFSTPHYVAPEELDRWANTVLMQQQQKAEEHSQCQCGDH
ncbi:DHH family phosphohydrolase/phosphoesterase [Vibrio phage vB_VcorM_GR7B]|nr:DHH family phosphohydrolase/phosphoesterase [Vibrio phage vB_VcorM_GR7B]